MPGCVGEFSTLVFTFGGLVNGEMEKKLDERKEAVSNIA